MGLGAYKSILLSNFFSMFGIFSLLTPAVISRVSFRICACSLNPCWLICGCLSTCSVFKGELSVFGSSPSIIFFSIGTLMCSRRTILLYLLPSWASIIAISLSLLPSFLSWSNLSSMGILPSSSSGSGKSLTLLTYQMHYFKTSCQESCQEKSRVLPRQFKTSWQEKSRVLPRKIKTFCQVLSLLQEALVKSSKSLI